MNIFFGRSIHTRETTTNTIKGVHKINPTRIMDPTPHIFTYLSINPIKSIHQVGNKVQLHNKKMPPPRMI